VGRQDRAVRHDPLRSVVEASIEGDAAAIAQLVRSTQPAVWRVCAALGSSGEVEDLVQETFLRSLRSLPSFRYDSTIEVWLLSIARRVCADRVRHHRRERRLLARLDHREDVVLAPDASTHDLLSVLSPQRREAFVLTQIAGLSYEEAALAIGCPIGTVRSRVSRARVDLAGVLAKTATGTGT
jgi:RNA polymerase sigma-70 factor (ECF subfamily)